MRLVPVLLIMITLLIVMIVTARYDEKKSKKDIEQLRYENYWFAKQRAERLRLHEDAPKLLYRSLDNFWYSEMKHGFPERNRSILSSENISRLVAIRPSNRAEWLESMPLDVRYILNPDELGFLEPILRIIDRYN